jgi:hypothetical protein
MSWKTDKLVQACEVLEPDYPRAKRALVAMRRSGRDRMFSGHVAWRRIQLAFAKPLRFIVMCLDRFLRRFA